MTTNPSPNPGLLLPDSLQNKFNFSADLKFTLKYWLPRASITANMSLGFIPVELIIRAPTTISCLAVTLIPASLLNLRLMMSGCLLDKNSTKSLKLDMSLWSHDVPPLNSYILHLSEWSSPVIKSFKEISKLCSNPLLFFFFNFIYPNSQHSVNSATYVLSNLPLLL